MATFIEDKSQLISPKAIAFQNDYVEAIVASNKNTLFYAFFYDEFSSTRIESFDVEIENSNKHICYLNEKEELEYIFDDHNHIITISEEEPEKITVKCILSPSDISSIFGYHLKPIEYISVANKDKLLMSYSEDNVLKIWDINSGECIEEINFPRMPNDITLVNRLYIIGNDDTFSFWIFDIKKRKFVFEEQECSVKSIIVANNLAFILKKNNVLDCRLLNNGSSIWSKSLNSIEINAVEIYHDHNKQLLFVSIDNGSICVIDPSNGDLQKVISGHNGGVWNMISTSSNLITSGFDETIRIWDIDTGECKAILVGHMHRILGMILSKENNYLISWDKLGCIISWKAYWEKAF
ncbi:MAG: hypothetical protein AAF383_27775 [Cyanobacteria bacterium P01_A01_bin.83]